jgi:hypothetical protein
VCLQLLLRSASARPPQEAKGETMSMTIRFWALALGAALGFSVSHAGAQQAAWRPATTVTPPAAAPSGPAATIGRPIPIVESSPSTLPPSDSNLTPVSHADPIPPTWSEEVIIRTQGEGPPPVPPSGAPPAGPYLDPTVNTDVPLNGGGIGGFWNNSGNWYGKRCSFQSDHCFDVMISPVANPFFFEDPRSLTEVRPIFIYQSAPNSTPVFAGGHSEFFGLQARVALTDKWSIVMNKLGFVSLHPNDPMDGVSSQTGFAEVDIGPKWTFFRNESTGTLLATGLTFQIPTGSAAAQNTGTLGLVPYITFAQNFGRNWLQSYGSFNFMAEAGYNFAVDDKRSEYFQGSLHLDYDVANLHRIYPLIELNWFHLTKRGDERPLTFEGADLVNFGSQDVEKRDLVTLDVGARYKIREWLQLGGAVEFPVSSYKGISDFRLTFDVIIRY